jgi:hypothetical protein
MYDSRTKTGPTLGNDAATYDGRTGGNPRYPHTAEQHRPLTELLQSLLPGQRGLSFEKVGGTGTDFCGRFMSLYIVLDVRHSTRGMSIKYGSRHHED